MLNSYDIGAEVVEIEHILTVSTQKSIITYKSLNLYTTGLMPTKERLGI